MMIKYSSCSNHLWFLPCCHQNNILLRDLHVKIRIKSEKNPHFTTHWQTVVGRTNKFESYMLHSKIGTKN